MEARFLGLQGNIYYQQTRYAQAITAYNRALELDNNYFEYYLGRGLTNRKRGKVKAARQDLQRSNQLLPTAIANNALGELSMAEGDRNSAKRHFQIAMNASGDIGDEARANYTRLDLTENPGRYIRTEPGLTSDGLLIATVRNTSTMNVARLKLQFSASVNDKHVETVVSIESLKPNEVRRLSSDWKLNAADSIQQVELRIISAEIE